MMFDVQDYKLMLNVEWMQVNNISALYCNIVKLNATNMEIYAI